MSFHWAGSDDTMPRVFTFQRPSNPAGDSNPRCTPMEDPCCLTASAIVHDHKERVADKRPTGHLSGTGCLWRDPEWCRIANNCPVVFEGDGCLWPRRSPPIPYGRPYLSAGVGAGGAAPILCAWFWLGRLASMTERAFAVFMRSKTPILCAIGWADRVAGGHNRLACPLAK
jgi:hypothetical protein